MAKAKKSKLTIEDALVPVEEQPYEIPENWCWTFVNAVCIFENGYAFKSDKFGEEGTPVIRISNIQENEVDLDTCVYTSEEDIEERFVVKKGDLLIAMSGATTGKNGIYLSDERAYLNQRVGNIKVRNSEVLLLRFRDFYIMSKQEEILNSAYGGAQPNISSTKIGEMLFPLPPLAEQKRIVEQIESLFAKLDEAKEKVLEALTSYQNRKTMIIHNAFVGNYTRAWRERNGHSIDDWKHLTLNDVAEYKKGPFGSSITKAMFVPKSSNTYKVYEQGNAIRKTIDYGSYYITEEKYRELKGFAIQAGDIIISCAGTIGEVYKLPEGCEAGVINQALMRVRTFDNIDEKFFIYYFGEVLKGDVNEQANGTAIKNIPPFKIMKAMEIKLPTLAEQREIVALLDGVLDSEKQSEDALNMMIEHIDLMKKSILAKAFRGELGTNNPEEESSIALLKEMLEKN